MLKVYLEKNLEDPHNKWTPKDHSKFFMNNLRKYNQLPPVKENMEYINPGQSDALLYNEPKGLNHLQSANDLDSQQYFQEILSGKNVGTKSSAQIVQLQEQTSQGGTH